MCDGCALAIVYTYACDDETALFACDGLASVCVQCSYIIIIICDQVGTYMPSRIGRVIVDCIGSSHTGVAYIVFVFVVITCCQLSSLQLLLFRRCVTEMNIYIYIDFIRLHTIIMYCT